MTPLRRGAPAAGRLLATACLAGLLLAVSGAPVVAAPTPPPPPLVEGPLATVADPPEVDAEAWVLLDVATGQIMAERDAGVRRPVASTVKILTALTVAERVEPDETVTVGEEVEVGGASVGLSPGDEWTVEQLLDALVARSGNDAAEALAAHVAGDMGAFVELMRDDARALGLDDAVITEASGLDDGNQLSARDLGVLARAALREPALREVFAREQVDLPGQGSVETRNELLGAYPGATGMKTGYTAAAGFALVGSAARDGRELIAVVLGAQEDPGRFRDAAALLDHGFDDFTAERLAVDWSLPVAGGRRSLTAGPADVVVPAGARLGWSGLPAAVPDGGGLALGVRVDDHEVAGLDAELGPGPAPVEGTAALGRALVDQVHAALRATSAEGAW